MTADKDDRRPAATVANSNMPLHHFIPVLVALLLLMATGCGGGERPPSGGRPEAGASPSPSFDPAEEQKMADAVLLLAGDLPAGFVQAPDTDESPSAEESPTEEEAFDKCVGDQGEQLDEATTAEAEAPDFERGDALASSLSMVVKTEADAREGVRVFGSDQIKECLRQTLSDTFRDGIAEELGPGEPVPQSQVSVETLTFPAVADEVTAFRLNLTVPSLDLTFPSDFVLVRKGRTLGFYFFTNSGTPFPLSDQQAAIGKAMGRLP